MKKGIFIIILILLYLSMGLFTVGGNEQALVQRFGKLVTSDGETPYLYPSGIHLDLPWPFAKVTRFNLNEIRSVQVGVLYPGTKGTETIPIENENPELDFLTNPDQAQPARFLTGDKNIIELKLTVQYRILESELISFLFRNEDPDYELKVLAESVITDLISRSGVDYVHPSGLAELQVLLTRQVRQKALDRKMGIEVDHVTMDSVMPPIQVKPWFIDVSNARADKEKFINTANNYLLQKEESAKADSRQIIDQAIMYQNETIEKAKGFANRFDQLVNQLVRSEKIEYKEARTLASRRMYLATMKRIFGKVNLKVIYDEENRTDLNLFPDTGFPVETSR